MELMLQTNPLCYLKTAVREVRCQEETGETLVPDGEPDIATLADCAAEVYLRGKDLREGTVTVAGGVKGTVLYLPEDGTTVRCLECYLPFTIKVEHPALTDRSDVCCELRVRSVDARILNARKALLRVNLACAVTAYQAAAETFASMESAIPGVEIRETVTQMELPLEMAERAFVLSDALELPAGRPPIETLCRSRCDLLVTDQKIVGDKALFKGTLTCKVLYRAPDGSLQRVSQALPYSQYCTLDREYDQETVAVLPLLTGCDIESEGGAEPRRVLLTAHILAQCLVSGTRTVRVIEDAYATDGQLEPEWTSVVLSPCLDRQSRVETVQAALAAPLRDVVDAEAYVDFPAQNRQEGAVSLRMPVQFRVLGYDGDGRLTAVTAQGEAGETMALAGNADCVTVCRLAEGAESIGVSGNQVRCKLRVDSAAYAQQPISCLQAAQWEPEAETGERPSVILRSVPADTALWDLAKSCRASAAAIRAVNHLEGDRISKETMVLIPVG